MINTEVCRRLDDVGYAIVPNVMDDALNDDLARQNFVRSGFLI